MTQRAAVGVPRWRVQPQMPQLRLGDFAFQNAALADWPAGGLRFHLQGRETTPLKPKEEKR